MAGETGRNGPTLPIVTEAGNTVLRWVSNVGIPAAFALALLAYGMYRDFTFTSQMLDTMRGIVAVEARQEAEFERIMAGFRLDVQKAEADRRQILDTLNRLERGIERQGGRAP